MFCSMSVLKATSVASRLPAGPLTDLQGLRGGFEDPAVADVPARLEVFALDIGGRVSGQDADEAPSQAEQAQEQQHDAGWVPTLPHAQAPFVRRVSGRLRLGGAEGP